jgi:hypothetical protein
MTFIDHLLFTDIQLLLLLFLNFLLFGFLMFFFLFF